METTVKRSAVDRFLSVVERTGNALPHPVTLFFLFCVLILVASAIAAWLNLVVVHPTTGAEIRPLNLLSVEGLHRIMNEMVTNFTGFAPLGTVLVAMLGIGIAEGSGLIGSALKVLVTSAPKRMLTMVIVFAGVLSNAASEVGYVLLVPLSGLVFLAVGRHPLAGIAASFAGVSGGYSANLLLGTIDPLLAGLSTEAARIVDPTYLVNPAANFYFMFGSTFLITALGTWITESIVIPRLGPFHGKDDSDTLSDLKPAEKRGLWAALVVVLILAGILVMGLVPEQGFLRSLKDGSILHSPVLSGVVAVIFVAAALAGIVYGLVAGTFKSDGDVIKGMSKSMETMGSYMVLVFVAAQFVAFFKWSNLGLIFAVEGSILLKASGLGPIPLMLGFMMLTAVVNLAMGSASAKWAVMAPVFIPMFMLLGISPEVTQTAYRVGDSVTNIISPMMSYFPLIIAFIQKYDEKAGIGTVVSTMIPYSIIFGIGWAIFFSIWYLLGIPVGPGAPMSYPAVP